MEWGRGRIIGRGSSAATVSSATSSHSGQVFAVKSAKLSQARFLQREQEILSTLRSPYIVGYIGHEISDESDELMYNLFMEYVPGGTLADTIRKKGGRLNESTIGYYTRQVLLGLEYLHSIGIAHCDIKGQNILIGDTGAKVADFGCARRQGLGDDPARPIGGTPMFMAPEVARGEHQGFPADVWALGCTVIEMATGTAPWPDQADPVSALYRIAYSGESPDIPDFLSAEATDFLNNCLRRDAKDRWTVEQLLNHSFLAKPEPCSEKQSMDFDRVSNFNSPTSTLDLGVWNSIPESETPCGVIRIDSGDRLFQRVGLLGSSCAEPTWSGDENWITIRRNTGREIELR